LGSRAQNRALPEHQNTLKVETHESISSLAEVALGTHFAAQLGTLFCFSPSTHSTSGKAALSLPLCSLLGWLFGRWNLASQQDIGLESKWMMFLPLRTITTEGSKDFS
jgi:hypothetical protein